MNKILTILSAILMTVLNVACSNMDDIEEINTEWGTEGLIPGELVPSFDHGQIHILWERPSIKWAEDNKLNDVNADIQWRSPYSRKTESDCQFYFHMMGINKCNSLAELVNSAATIACGPDSSNEKGPVSERIQKYFPSDIDFEKQSVFLFYFLAPDKFNSISLFTNPANNKPVFMAYTLSDFDYAASMHLVSSSNRGLMGFIVINTPDLTVKDLEIWTKIGKEGQPDFDGFDKEYPDWKVKEWKDKVIYPNVGFYDYHGMKKYYDDGSEDEYAKSTFLL